MLTDNIHTILLVELYKGWLFVFISAVIIFILVRKILIRHETTKIRLQQNLLDLNKTHADLIELEEELITLAYTDTLTKMPNKISFENNMNRLISFHDKEAVRFAFLHLDIDNFKNINDIMGHSAGDLFLKEFGSQLQQSISDTDLAARLNGDEFAIIIHDTPDNQKIYLTLDILIERLRKPWIINRHEFFITFSIGITIFPDDGNTTSVLMRNADTAMYSVKRITKDSYSFYSKEILEENLRKIDMINSLRKAVNQKEFKLLYQPIIHLGTNRLIGVEALIRWHHPYKGIISPVEFIPLAEESGLINEIDKWVLESAFKQKKEWTDKGFRKLRMSINISGNSLRREGLVEDIKRLLNETGVDSSDIMLEVTETVLIENIGTSVEILNRIKNMGIRIALDDFGTGYSSLTYLEKLPIDVVKLDRSFVNDIVKQNHVDIIVENIIRLTHDLLLEITAEGIETSEQLEYLKSKLCDYGQGYYFSKPVDHIAIEGML
jgi:diguanylate cyclase (GGDEF)-like protein